MRFLCGLAAGLLLVVAFVPTASASDATKTRSTEVSAARATPRCVTRAEYRRAHRGMNKRRVHRIFDFRGVFLDGHGGGYTRGYSICGHPWDAALVTYRVPIHRVHGPHRVAEKRWNVPAFS